MISIMSKFTKLLSVLLLVFAFVPFVQADEDQPLRIKSATVETEDHRVVGKVTVCNTENERVRFVLDVKNHTINSIYKRRMTVAGNDCVTSKLRFTKNFAEMSNVGDDIEFIAKHVKGQLSKERYYRSDKYMTEVITGDRDYTGCADQAGEDGVFNACETDFITHTPSGLRIKVVENDGDYVKLKLTHIEWGGVKEMRLYKGRMKKIRSNYDQLERVEISNLYGENTKQLYLKIESI